MQAWNSEVIAESFSRFFLISSILFLNIKHKFSEFISLKLLNEWLSSRLSIFSVGEIVRIDNDAVTFDGELKMHVLARFVVHDSDLFAFEFRIQPF